MNYSNFCMLPSEIRRRKTRRRRRCSRGVYIKWRIMHNIIIIRMRRDPFNNSPLALESYVYTNWLMISCRPGDGVKSNTYTNEHPPALIRACVTKWKLSWEDSFSASQMNRCVWCSHRVYSIGIVSGIIWSWGCNFFGLPGLGDESRSISWMLTTLIATPEGQLGYLSCSILLWPTVWVDSTGETPVLDDFSHIGLPSFGLDDKVYFNKESIIYQYCVRSYIKVEKHVLCFFLCFS